MGNKLQTTQLIDQTPRRHHHHHQQQQQPPDLQTQNFTCEICIESISSPTNKFKNKNLCAHPFCVDCIIKYIQAKLEDNVGEIPCPALNCTHSLHPISCRTILPPQMFVKWCDVLCESFVLGLDCCYCPYRNCSVLIVNECGGNLKKCKCPKCKRLFCFKCKVPWHAGFRCEESRELMEPNDVAFGVLAELNNWMRCPRCHHFVQLVEGCRIIKCRCRASFCYNCGKEVNRHWCSCDRACMFCLGFLRFCTIITCVFAIIVFFLTAIKFFNVFKTKY